MSYPVDDLTNNNTKTPNSPNSDPWLNLSNSNKNTNNNMDAELASIVSSLSALSNPSNFGNSNNNNNANNSNMMGSSSIDHQLGGFRRNSFTSSDIDSDILINSNGLTTMSVSGGSNSNLDMGSPLMQRSTQSIGTAPPYTSNMFNINYKLFQNNNNNNNNSNSSNSQQFQQMQQMRQQQQPQQHPDSKSVSFALNNNDNITAMNNNQMNSNSGFNKNKMMGKYSASIAGPILQNDSYYYYSNGNNNASASQSIADSQTSMTSNRGGFFQQLGQSLIEGTKELEFDGSSSGIAATSNNNREATFTGSQVTLDNFARSSDGEEYTDFNSSGTAANDANTANMLLNATNVPSFKPGNGASNLVGSPPQNGLGPGSAGGNGGAYFMNYQHNYMFNNGSFYPPAAAINNYQQLSMNGKNDNNSENQNPNNFVPQMMFPNSGSDGTDMNSVNNSNENDMNNMKAGNFIPMPPNAVPVNNVSNQQMFMPPSQLPQNNNNNNNSKKNPYIYIQNPNLGSPPGVNPASFAVNKSNLMNPESSLNSHVNNSSNKSKHQFKNNGNNNNTDGGNNSKHRKNNNSHANPYLDQSQSYATAQGKSFKQASSANAPFSSKNSSNSNTSVLSNSDDDNEQFAHDGKKKSNNSNATNQAIYHRSPLLEDIRNYATNNNGEDGEKTYSLKDILGHTLEFCKDQYGSRFIQKQLATASPSEREVLFNEIRDDAVMLANDVFGNYVIQKFFEYGSSTQKDILVDQFRGRMKELSMQMYACRVIQKALEFINPQQRIDLVDELKDCVLKMIKDQNGNHVIQKAIETIPIDLLPFVLKSLIGHIYHLSTHSYGCRVIQRLLEFGSEDDQKNILSELKDFIPYLIQDQYGNYVIQYILQHGSDSDSTEYLVQTKQDIINIISENVVEFSKHKFASNVVEKAVLYGTNEQKSLIISKILPKDKEHALNLEDNAPMILMMRDQFANYVVQKLVTVTEGEGKKLIVIAIRAYLDKLNKSNSLGNRHLASVEKLAALVENVEI